MATSKQVSFGEKTEALDVAAHFASQIKDKIILITGVNPAGLGFSAAEAFASQHPRLLLLTGRAESKVRESITKLSAQYPSVKYLYLKLDLSTLADTKTAAESVLANQEIPHIDVLVNNAGLANASPDIELSADGVEVHFAVNHLAPFLFTNLIMPKLIAASRINAPGATRVINLSSEGHSFSPVRFSDFNFAKVPGDLPESEKPNIAAIHRMIPSAFTKEGEKYNGMAAYGQSKTANSLFSIGLNRRLYQKYGILSLAVHPGAVGTELNRSIPPEILEGLFRKWMELGLGAPKTLGEGSSTTLRCAVDPDIQAPDEELGKFKGIYWSDCQPTKAADWAEDGAMAERLWTTSEEMVRQRFEHSKL